LIIDVGLDGRSMKVEVDTCGTRPRVSVDGVVIECDWDRISDGHYLMIADGRVLDLSVFRQDNGLSIATRDGTFLLTVNDPRLAGLRHVVAEGGAGLQQIRADMPGKVIRLLVSEGDTVSYDKGLLVLEAMKMQNEIRSPKTGVVREIRVQPGRAVNSGDLLLSIE